MQALYFDADSVAAVDAPYLGFLVADRLYDLNDYAGSRRVLDRVLLQRPDWKLALMLRSALARNTGAYDEAMQFADRVAVLNADDPTVPAMRARIELKRKRDAEARRYAVEAMALDSNDVNALEAIAMVEFYEGQTSASRARLARIADIEFNSSGDSALTMRLRGLLDGRESFR
jgi:predicted Zn-dependent protease